MNTTAPVYCPDCGRELPAGAVFCSECGHDLTVRAAREPEVAPPDTRACSGCHSLVPSAAEFCPSCGATMVADESLVPTLEIEVPAAPPPPPSEEPRSPNRRVLVAGAAVVVLVGCGIAFALTSGGESSPETENAARAGTATDPVAATPEPAVEMPTPEPAVEMPTPEPTIEVPTPEPALEQAPAEEPALAEQVQRLDGLMQMSVQGRAAAISGDAAGAMANRERLLRELQTLRSEAADPELQAAIDGFIPAIRESLRQNRECGSSCSDSELRYVGRLKRDALSELNPLLREYVGRTYTREEI
jgi:RNA polymerase subunit RPABC4/transcription elongation factor Spt4